MTEPNTRPDVAGFLAYVNGLQRPEMKDVGAAAAREGYAMMKDLVDLPASELAVKLDLSIPGPAGEIKARFYDVRADREPGPAVAFFHGGGFVIGDLETHDSACAEIARVLDLPLVAFDYRLAPEAPWPAAPDDCEAAARWLAGSPVELNRSVTSLVVCGDSAGGNLSVVVAADLRDKPAAVPVIAQLLLYPATDSTKDYPSFAQFAEGRVLTRSAMAFFYEAYASEVDHVRASPLLGDLAGLPPAVILTAGLDPIRDQGRAYAAALIDAGVAVTYREAVGNVHGFLTMRKAIPSSQGDVAGFLTAAKALIGEAEAVRVMAQAA